MQTRFAAALVAISLAPLATVCTEDWVPDDLDAAMQKESSVDSAGQPPRVGHCGDGLLQPEWEECDEPHWWEGECADIGEPNGVLQCNGCRYDRTLCLGVGVCGNGLVEGGEECDPPEADTACAWGASSCVVCTDACTLEPGELRYCGDGVLTEPWEACDAPYLGGVDCADLGYRRGTLSCNDACEHDPSGCDQTFCGDGVHQPQFEFCDNPDPVPTCTPGVDEIRICIECYRWDTVPCAEAEPGEDDADTGASVDGSEADDNGGDANGDDDGGGSRPTSGCSAVTGAAGREVAALVMVLGVLARRRRTRHLVPFDC